MRPPLPKTFLFEMVPPCGEYIRTVLRWTHAENILERLLLVIVPFPPPKLADPHELNRRAIRAICHGGHGSGRRRHPVHR